MSRCQGKTCLLAPAKLNLGLRIVGRRPDGYHELESVFWPVDFCDEMSVTPAPRNRVGMEWAEDAPVPTALPTERENLLWKALEAATQLGAGHWDIQVKKRIPVGGGLGGGSSNCGTLLGHLSRAWPDLAPALRDIAIALGADVPFFLDPRPSWVTGIGETLRPLVASNAPRYFNLVFLPQPTSTQRIFEIYRARGGFSERQAEGLFFSNDLETFAAEHYPLIGEVLDALRVTPSRYAGLSGSGSTCFAAYDREEEAENSLKDLAQFFRKNNCKNLKVSTLEATGVSEHR